MTRASLLSAPGLAGRLVRAAFVAACAALALATVASAPARADDDPPAPVPGVRAGDSGDLTREEIAALRRRFRQWDVLDEAARERIAKNVVRLRTMTPEEREKVFERARRLDRAGALAKAQFGERHRRLSRLSPEDVRRAREGRALVRAAGRTVLEALALEARSAVEGLSDPERAQWDACALSLLRRDAIGGLAARPPAEFEVPAGLPKEFADRVRAEAAAVALAGGTTAPERLRRRFAETVVEARLLARLRDSGRERGGVERIAAGLSADFPEAVASAAATVDRAVRGGPDGLATLCEDAGARRAALFRDRALLDVFLAIERRRGALADASPDLASAAATLQARILGSLGATSSQVEAFASAATPAEREDALDGIERVRRLRRR